MNRGHIDIILRVLSFGVALAMWYISVIFSIDGFGIIMPDMFRMGVIMAICITGIELIANQRDANLGLTIIVVGVGAYIYGIYTNVIGITAARGIAFLDADWKHLIFPIAWAIVLEIAPERFIIWALTGDNYGDFLENVFSGFSLKRKRSIPMVHGQPMMNRPMMPPSVSPSAPPGLRVTRNPNGRGSRVPMGKFEE